MERRGLNIRKGFLKVFLPMIRALPLPVASRFVSGIGRMEYRVSHRLRAAFQQAVAHGRSVLDGQWDVPAVSRELEHENVTRRQWLITQIAMSIPSAYPSGENR